MATAPVASRWRLVVGVGLLLLVLAGALGWAGWWYGKRSQENLLAALEANNRGVGHMEQFKYDPAVAEFEEAVRLAPDWLPGHINLGIALLNTDRKPELERAKQVFERVLSKDADNPYAHFCLGILLKYQKDADPAIKHFEAVTRIDPKDASAWYFLGSLLRPGSEKATECYRKAHELDPYQRGALYQRTQDQSLSGPQRKAALAEFRGLDERGWLHAIDIKYGEMGPYANVIGRRQPAPAAAPGPLPRFERRALTVRLADGVRWAKAADFGKDEAAQIRVAVRARFGGTVVVLDYNGDRKPDLFLAGAVVEKGQVRDLLLRNDGEGTFTDVTAAAGLAKAFPTLGCCVADFDNDGHPDLLLTGVGGVRLFRNTGKSAFEDLTAKAGLDRLTSVCLSAAAVDLDQDSDLDLLICEYAATPADALKQLKGEKVAPSGALAVYLHEGEAEPQRGPKPPPPLTCRFQRATTVAALQGPAAAVAGLAVSDVDGDRDLDFLVLADSATPAVVLNDRLLRFRRLALPDALAPPGAWNGALVLDADHDGRSDLLLVRAGRPPLLLLNRAAGGEKDVEKWFTAGASGSPPLRQAVAVDVDLDSWTDVVGLSEQGAPTLLRNVGGRLVPAADALGPPDKGPRDLIGLAVLDALGTGRPDVLLWSESEGLQLLANAGNDRHGLRVRLAGRNRVEKFHRTRCNADGVGAWVVAQAGETWAGQENTTLSAGLGQSRQPLLLGLGRFSKADVLRLRWPDLTIQAELNVPTEGMAEVVQSDRRSGSCPILFAWDGRRFGFVTDFLGAGSMGELGPDGSTRPPRPEESVKIEAEQLVPRDGQYVLKVAEPMDEVTYLDRVQLVVLDHPPGVRVYPDERFATADPPPSQKLFAFQKTVFPASARDHRGRDVTAKLRAWDRDTVDGFARRAWVGFAEEHAVELDFGDRLAAYGPAERLVLCLAGWTEYPYPESIWAAQQAGVAMLPPVLERQGPDGRWRKVCEAGFPAGLPKLMTLDVTGKLTGPACRLRLRTNLQVYWDQIFVAVGCRDVPVPSAGPVRSAALEVSAAGLRPCGLMQEFSPDGRRPTLYDHDRYETVPVVRPAGRMTRYGDVTELLRARDDRFVLFGPGDEVTLRFDARSLPPLPAGWKRSFVLRTWGYCKDAAPFTATGGTVEPLPFAAMSRYPYGPDEHYPKGPLHEEYRRRYNTRAVRPETFPAKPRR